MIRISNLTKKYGTFCAVNNISFSVANGEIFGFLGVNGAGKTTTLRMLAGVIAPTAGEINIGGYDLNSDPVHAKAITGYIPDRPYLYSKLTGREFLLFCADLYNLKRADAEKKADQLLEEYGLIEWQNSMIDSYSHGMKQRLATCSALIHDPKVLIVDEPMVGLDPHGAKLLKEQLKRYASNGMSIILSTHTLSVAEELSDHIAIINKGQILTSGTLEEIRAVSHDSKDTDLENIFLHITEPQNNLS